MEWLNGNGGLTRRQWLGGALALGASAALPAWAQSPEAWPNVTRLMSGYVRIVSNVFLNVATS